MKFHLIIIALIAFACTSPKQPAQVCKEIFTAGRADTLRKTDSEAIDTLRSIQTILLGVEFGSDSTTTYNKLQEKLRKTPEGTLIFDFPSPKITTTVKPYFYQGKLWKVELYETLPASRDDFDAETIGHNALSTILQKYYSEAEISTLPVSTIMDIPGETTCYKTKDNLLIAVRSHPSEGITIGYIDLYTLRQIRENAATELSADL